VRLAILAKPSTTIPDSRAGYGWASANHPATGKFAVICYIVSLFFRALYVVTAFAIALFGAVVGLALDDADGLWFAKACALLAACIWLSGLMIRKALGWILVRRQNI
jgi:hypothetical protein